MKLSPDVRRVWRRFSFQALGWAGGFAAWWASNVAPDMKEAIGVDNAILILAALCLSGMVGSCIDQPSTKEPK
jgi:hypothetical protein